MIINAVFYELEVVHADEARELLRELRDRSREERGCRRFDVSQSVDAPAVFVLYEEWDDQVALERHYASEHFDRLGTKGIRRLAISRIGHICAAL